ncbi:uncharacterized protein [Euphorbia lathyris]|uniref:uncharacterized protein n=1 Tax=Euphorbia lathyris TaxID=212925 RepID=UPI003313CC66
MLQNFTKNPICNCFSANLNSRSILHLRELLQPNSPVRLPLNPDHHNISDCHWLKLEEQEEEEKGEEELAKMNESKSSEEDVALKEMTTPGEHEAQELARARTLDKQEQSCTCSFSFNIYKDWNFKFLMIFGQFKPKN